MRNQRFPVVGFNAWETDFSQYPFITFSSELELLERDQISPRVWYTVLTDGGVLMVCW